eukprot:2849985-Rhodomonas_salina.1
MELMFFLKVQVSAKSAGLNLDVDSLRFHDNTMLWDCRLRVDDTSVRDRVPFRHNKPAQKTSSISRQKKLHGMEAPPLSAIPSLYSCRGRTCRQVAHPESGTCHLEFRQQRQFDLLHTLQPSPVSNIVSLCGQMQKSCTRTSTCQTCAAVWHPR